MSKPTISININRTRDGMRGIVNLIIRRHKTYSQVSLKLSGPLNTVVQEHYDSIIRAIKIAYCIIEEFQKREIDFYPADIVERFKAVGGIASTKYDERIALEGDKFNINEDIAGIRSFFRESFRIVRSHDDSTNLLAYIDSKSYELRNANRMSLFRSYRSLKNALADYLVSREMLLSGLDKGEVEAFQSYLIGKGCAVSTVSFYIRTLRSVLYVAADEGLCDANPSWFEDVNTSVQNLRHTSELTEKKALDRESLRAIADAKLETEEMRLTRDLFMFSFYCKGMELVDVATLTHCNLKNDILRYQKRRKGLLQVIKLGENALTILKKYATPHSQYLFPLLEGKGLRGLHGARQAINRQMAAIGEFIGLRQPLSFSTSHYTWQALIERADISEAFLR